MNKNLLIALGIIILVLAGTLGYFILQNQQLIKKIADASPTPLTSTTQSPQISPETAPSSPSPKLTLAQVQENIEASLNSKNYQAISIYTTDPVNFILMSTECCGPLIPDEAVNQMSYIQDGEPFNFDQSTQLVKNLKAKNERLADAFIGISTTDEQLAAFKFDTNNNISSIELAISYNLYEQ